MSKQLFLLLILIIVCVQPLNAERIFTAEQVFTCSGSEVYIGIKKVPDGKYSVDVEFKVSRNTRSTILIFNNIDHIGGTCHKMENNKYRIVFQAYCNGSGCNDASNWGVVDPETLRVLLVPLPSDTNYSEAKRLVGGELPRIDTMVNVEGEKERLGIPLY